VIQCSDFSFQKSTVSNPAKIIKNLFQQKRASQKVGSFEGVYVMGITRHEGFGAGTILSTRSVTDDNLVRKVCYSCYSATVQNQVNPNPKLNFILLYNNNITLFFGMEKASREL
jgi:hypothetical protein